jgi:hypothetical protein
MTEDDVLTLLKRKAKDLGGNAALARSLEVSPQYLGDVLRGNRPPGISVLSPLGLEKIVTYRRIA